MDALVGHHKSVARQLLQDFREEFDGDIEPLRDRAGTSHTRRRLAPQILQRQQRVIGLFRKSEHGRQSPTISVLY